MSKHHELDDVFLSDQIEAICCYLSLLHPFLLDNDNKKACIEIRPISREGYNYTLSRSINLWNLNLSSKKRLEKYLHNHLNKPYCLYYSVYAMDYDKESYTKTGKKAQKGRITENNVLFTQEVVLDFDNINEKDYQNLLLEFKKMRLDGIWIFTGHGYQVHFLLKKQTNDIKLLKRIVNLFYEKGFNCDLSCTNASRVMRLPFTYNYKCFDDEQYKEERNNPPFAYIVKETEARYSIDEIIESISNYKLQNKETIHVLLNQQKKEQKEKAIQSVSTKDDYIALKKEAYTILDKYNIPDPINQMLNYTPHGFRNKVLGFLIKYFKEYLKLGKSQIHEILEIWANKACSPIYESNKFLSDFTRLYYNNGLYYDASLTSQFGYIDFENQIRLIKQYIYISNSFLKQMKILHGNSIKLYLGVKLLEHLKKEATIETISDITKLSIRTVKTHVKQLISLNYLYVIKGNRRLKEANQYFTNKITNISEGYMKTSYNDVLVYINELGIGELKLYLFMSYKFFYGDCFMAQRNIGENIGLKQNTISELTKKLEQKYFIRIVKTPMYQTNSESFIYSCTYILLR